LTVRWPTSRAGRVRVDRIVTDELPLSEYGEALAGARERRSVKAMLTPAE